MLSTVCGSNVLANRHFVISCIYMTTSDTPRPVATSDAITDPLPTDAAHLPALTMEDVASLYENAGVPRNLRSLQRYAQQGKLSAQKIMTATGSQYLVTPHSVELHLTELRQMEAQARLVATGRDLARQDAAGFESGHAATPATPPPRPAMTSHDMPSPVAPIVAATSAQTFNDNLRQTPPTNHDTPRQVAARTDVPADDRYVKLLESQNEFLRQQIDTKDTQIMELTTRSRETHSLFAQLQHMLSPLLGTGRGDTTRRDA